MKTAFFRTVFLLLTLGFVSVVLTATAREEKPPKSKNENRHIFLGTDRSESLPPRPRMPAHIAIECMYEAAGESLSFQFFEEMGGVTVTVVNTTTGEMFFDVCSSTPGSCRTALSGDAGAYAIVLEDDLGRTYSGSFTL